MDRIHLLGAVSTLLSLAIMSKAFIERKGHFFATCIQITQSNLNLLILLAMTFYYVILTGKLIQRLWFGQLRVLEVEHLYERSWFSVMDTCLALTIFRDGFDLLFVLRFGTLLFCKTFHWITADRVDFMEQSTDTSIGFHFRMTSIMAMFLLIDISMFISAFNHTMEVGATMLIVFGFEYALLTTSIIGTFAKYLLHTIDLNRQTPWEEKSMYFFYVDLVMDFLKLISYMIFFGIVVHYYGIPLHIVRDVYMTLRSFLQRCRDLIRYRQATANMQERYPTANEIELAATDRICIVCREEMRVGTEQVPLSIPETPKKLPCGHIFHFRCLRSWLERQQACPTCRRSVLQDEAVQQPGQVQGPGPLPLQPRDVPPVAQGGAQGFPQGFPQAVPQGVPQPGQVPIPQANPQAVPQANPQAQQPTVTPNIVYPILLTPLPTPQVQVLDQLDDEQLQRLQGTSRAQIIARLETVNDIQRQLRGISTQLQQLLNTFDE